MPAVTNEVIQNQGLVGKALILLERAKGFESISDHRQFPSETGVFWRVSTTNTKCESLPARKENMRLIACEPLPLRSTPGSAGRGQMLPGNKHLIGPCPASIVPLHFIRCTGP